MADAMIFPSYYDSFGMVVAEAMASGVPCVVSRQAGASEWILQMENGILVENANDIHGFSDAINRLEHLDQGQCIEVASETHAPTVGCNYLPSTRPTTGRCHGCES